MLLDRRTSRRRRFIGPLGIGFAVLVGIAIVIAGNGAAPPSVVGGVAAATDAARPSPIQPGVAEPSQTTARATASAKTPQATHAADIVAVGAPPIDGLTGYQWPLPKARLTLPFGATPWGGWLVDGQRLHDGIDLATFCGDKVVAAHDGVILAAGRHYDDQMGWIGDLSKYYARLDAKKLWVTLPIVVVIDDGDGYRSVYAHFGKVVVKKGQTVTAGSLLGYEGRTGRASGCHLHYGLFSPTEMTSFTMDPVAARHMKLPGVEIARIDPQLVLPGHTKSASKARSAPSSSPKP